MKKINRREFIQAGFGSMAAIWAGTNLPPWVKKAYGQPVTQTLNFTITDAIKQMVTHNDINDALNYFWIFKEATLPAESPGPIVFTVEGGTITLVVTNDLDENHEFAIPGIDFTTGPIAPGDTFTGTIDIPPQSAGTYLYFDTLNAPVNRVMGLHGAFIIMPDPPNGTPYSTVDVAQNPQMAQLFADLGTAAWWPGLAWNEAGVNPAQFPDTPPFRQFVWLMHQASPRLFAAVGDNANITFTTFDGRTVTGAARDPAIFQDAFLNDLLVTQGKNKAPVENFTPQFFTISGQSGHFAHNTSFVTPHMRVGEPTVMRVLNAGLWTHCVHLHANHFFMMKVRNEITGFPAVATQFNAFPDLDPAAVPGILDNHIWLDVFGTHPGDVWDYVIPYMRPPDVPNDGGFARADISAPLDVTATAVDIKKFGARVDARGRLRKAAVPAAIAQTTWPPIQELNMNIPPVGTFLGPLLNLDGTPILDEAGLPIRRTPVHVPLSPLCFPMHDHSEPSQTTQGGNYNQGLIAGVNFTGDRNEDARLATATGNGLVVENNIISFPNTPLTFNDPEFDAAFNERAVHGADPETSPQPAAGPLPPFEEFMAE